MKLTPKQIAFVQEYLCDLNATQAAIRAGYSAKTAEWIGPQLLGKTHVFASIKKGMNQREKRTQITQDYVLRTIHETVERCRQARPVFDQNGDPVLIRTPTGDKAAAYTFDAKSVLRGCELLGKHLGLFEKDNRQRNPVDAVAAIIAEIHANAKRTLPSEDRGGKTLQCHW